MNDHGLSVRVDEWSKCTFIFTYLLLVDFGVMLAHKAEYVARDTKSVWGIGRSYTAEEHQHFGAQSGAIALAALIWY